MSFVGPCSLNLAPITNPLAPLTIGGGNKPFVIGNCSLCRRRLVESNVSWSRMKRKLDYFQNRTGFVPKATLDSSQLLSTFNKLQRHYLSDLLHEQCSSSDKDLPVMCQFCGTKLIELERISNALENKIKEFRMIVEDSTKPDTGTEGGMKKQNDKLDGTFLRINRSQGGGEESTDSTTLGFFGKCLPTFGSYKPQGKGENEGIVVKKEADDIQERQEEIMDCEMDEPPMTPFSPPDSPNCSLGRLSPSSSTSPAEVQDNIKTEARSETDETKSRESSRKLESKSEKVRPIIAITLFQKCDFCVATVSLQKILDHVREHVGEYACPCPVLGCGHVYSSPSKLESLHYKLRLKCRKIVKPSCQCRRGGHKGTKDTRKCTCPYEHICENCEYKAASFRQLADHLKSAHETPSSSSKNFICPVAGCEEAFTVRQSVYSHLDSDHQDLAKMNRPPARMQTCMECKRNYRYSRMGEHLRKIHGATEVIACKVCQLLFGSWEALLKHLVAHSTDPGGLSCFICNDDDTKYLVYNKLAHHYLTAHNVGSLLTCHLCGNTYFNERGLKRHMTLTHKDEQQGSSSQWQQDQKRKSDKKKPLLVCDVEGCGKVFSAACNLRKHKFMKHVESDGNLKCDVEGCGKSFKLWRDLNKHKQIVHLGIRRPREMCDLCGKYVWSLVKHKRFHVAELAYPCHFCGQRFRVKDSLHEHVKLHEKKGDSFKPRGPMKVVKRNGVQKMLENP